MPHRTRWAPSSPHRVGRVDPVGQCREVFVVKSESLSDRIEVDEVQHGGVREAAVQQFHQCAERSEEGVRRPKGPVGESVGEVWGAGHGGLVGVSPRAGGRAQNGFDERCELVEPRAEHHDVVLSQSGIICQEVQDLITQHLDLSGVAVAGVDLYRPVGNRG